MQMEHTKQVSELNAQLDKEKTLNRMLNSEVLDLEKKLNEEKVLRKSAEDKG
jgi:hypothetical protein